MLGSAREGRSAGPNGDGWATTGAADKTLKYQPSQRPGSSQSRLARMMARFKILTKDYF
jgi:hypothetical protein